MKQLNDHMGRKATNTNDEEGQTEVEASKLKTTFGSFYALLFSVVFWVVLIVLMGGDLIPNSAVCSSKFYFHNWTTYATFAEMCAFIGNALNHCIRLARGNWTKDRRSVNVIIFAALSINVVAGISSFLEFTFGYGGYCEDLMGVVLPLTMWLEWLVCVPLMAFVAVFVDDTADLRVDDYYLIGSLAGCILFGFIMALSKLKVIYFIFLALSNVCFLVAARIVYVNQKRSSHRHVSCLDDNIGMTTQKQKIMFEVTRSEKLASLLIFVLPPFPIIYMLAMANAISRDAAYVGLVIANFSSKYIFLSQACDVQVGLVDKLLALLVAEMSANDSRREFLRYVFHEVRVPLNSLMLGLDVVSQSKMDSNGNEAVLMMKESANFMADTLNDVLSMEKIEEGKMELNYTAFAIRHMIKSAAATVRGSAVVKSIALTVDVKEDVPRAVIGDKFRLEHVVANLLSNAIKFSPVGKGITLRVTQSQPYKPAAKPSSKICFLTISVIDEGPGIEAAELKRLFTPFHQIRPDDMQKGGGSGLGLSLAHSIVKLHGGQLICESCLGQGTTFTMDLQLEIADLESPGTPSKIFVGPKLVRDEGENATGGIDLRPAEGFDTRIERVSVGGGDQDNGGKQDVPFKMELEIPLDSLDKTADSTPVQTKNTPTFLIVDDTLSNRKMLAMSLKIRSVSTLLADDGQQAIDTVITHPGRIALIFMDNTMPVKTGVEATRVLRASVGFRNLVIGLTGNALDDDVAAFLEAGADIVLAKPLRPYQLDALLAFTADHGFESVPGSCLQMTAGNGRDVRVSRTVRMEVSMFPSTDRRYLKSRSAED